MSPRASCQTTWSHLQAGVYVPETLTGMELLEQFRANNMQMAFS